MIILKRNLRGIIRKIQSVLLLVVTISLLFYYTFQNEINMLNSYAENEYVPSINTVISSDNTADSLVNPPGFNNNKNHNNQNENINGLPRPFGDKNKIHDSSSDNPINNNNPNNNIPPKDPSKDLSDPAVLKVKNKYFPLLLPNISVAFDFETKAQKLNNEAHLAPPPQAQAVRENHPVLYEVSLPSSFNILENENENLIQATYFEDGGKQQIDMLADIKAIFLKSWNQENIYARAKSRLEVDWPITLIESLDTLFILDNQEEFVKAVDLIGEINFSIPPEHYKVADIADMSRRVLGGLLSSYELSQNTILLEKAKQLASFLLRAFDTPNRMPILHFFWQSTLKNRFPYQNSNLGQLNSMSLEFTRLAQLTGQSKYFDAIYRIYKIMADSSKEFDIDYLFPINIDATGCQLFSSEEISLGDHVRDSQVMKSINEDLKFVQCHQTGKFKIGKDDKLDGKETFSMDRDTISIYDTLAKLRHLLNNHDLLQLSESSLKASQPGEETINVKEDSKTSDNNEDEKELEKTKKIKQPWVTSKQLFVSALESVRELMFYTPMTPLYDNLTFISSLDTRSWFIPTTNEMSIDVSPHYDMNIESCSLASTFAFGSKVFNISEYIKIAENLTISCIKYNSLFSGILPKHSYYDPCLDGSSCMFDSVSKINNIKQGYYLRNEMDSSDSVIKVSQNLNKHPILEKENDNNMITKVLNFKSHSKKSILQMPPGFINENGEWSDNPEQPLWINQLDSSLLLSPYTIQSIFYMYRITGEKKWRSLGKSLFNMIIARLQKEGEGAKQTWVIKEVDNNGPAIIPSYWFSQTLKYYLLLFGNGLDYTLDKYVFTTNGHLIKRTNTIQGTTI
ncbi:hypothetical protein TBLA_0D02500 [Henningerozyma blattae CBS 6284]|uniref:alpha-1,2-Mannosidase n=1 Tax=Henningerozyma blattae (strain ATCC 34711 / CBS 6284 / DSM 70876 / NBRC 10599 / NRRL Y-10934 / UCD 77-7) TaxID=1071380 RepID=I2H301_HENB6|nr:hypothetical protein TBLA_0D02500 [Tetrapisispora blattae CBS 6284]CCH60753.1 hypothetical protein TBLA_0D02500 [Tetrapisispora blattae CBS 6284]